MPRTRNVSRSQWDAANTQQNSRASKENTRDESEKENGSRTTRSTTRAGSRRQVLGVSSTLGPIHSSTTKQKAKGKGKEKPPPKGTTTKTEKLPLQDITKRFLPAPESANRGFPQPAITLAQPDVISVVGSAASPLVLSGLDALRAEDSRRASTRRTLGRPTNAFPSSLPPSSPPLASSEAAQHQQENSELPVLPRSPPLPKLSRRLFDYVEPADGEQSFNAWSEFDDVVKESDSALRGGRTPRNSDPFGFFALEKKLEEERKLDEEDEEEAGGLILVADTSSPRPVRRLRPQYVFTAEEFLEEDAPHEAEEEDHRQQEEVNYDSPAVPPTPHKVKDRSRRSFGGGPVEHLFSPRPSSCPSSPSPSKPSTSSAKRKAASSQMFDNEDDEEEEQESRSKIPSLKVPGKKQAKLESDSVEEVSTRRQLRSRSLHQKAESSRMTSLGEEKRKGRTAKRDGGAPKKNKSRPKKVVSNNVDDPDMDQWERERQVRLEYFRQLEEYDVETENVYVI